MPLAKNSEPWHLVKLTLAQRIVVAEIAPEFRLRLQLEAKPQRNIPFTLLELARLQKLAADEVLRSSSGMKRNSLRRVAELATGAVELAYGRGAVPAPKRMYQFKITLRGSQPPIWRRIQVNNCTLDKLHEHIQTAMGWTNSHLHHFRIGEQLYGDPMLMNEDFNAMGYEDSTRTKLSDVLPRAGQRFQFGYEYDFGDSWEHGVVLEGCVNSEPGSRYPVCVEGERACPPEDVGGLSGYADFLEAIQNVDHEQHEELLTWVGGKFDPDEFDTAVATKRMHRGLPDLRRMANEVW